MKSYPNQGMSPRLYEQELDQALRLALGTSQPALRREALERAAQNLVHPRLILDSPLLTDSHPWRREALVVADAFEAVSNGMEEPGVLEALDDLGADSPFQAWRHFILALHFFYEGLDEAVRAHVAAIPASSPVRPLGRTLEALVSGERLPPGLARLAETVAHPDPLVVQCVQDVAEGLETEDEGLFWGALTDWLEAVADRAPERAQSAVVWAWNQLEWRDFDEATLLDLTSHLWGRAEAYRLGALGTLGWDPEGAALLWFRFLIAGVRSGELLQGDEAYQWLQRFETAAGPHPSPEWTEAWESLGHQWNAEARARGWNHLVRGTSPSPSTPPRAAQLDLFSL